MTESERETLGSVVAELTEPGRPAEEPPIKEDRGTLAFSAARDAHRAWLRMGQRKKELEAALRQALIDEAKAFEEYKTAKGELAAALEEGL